MIQKNVQRKEYLSRINKVIDYIDANLSSKFTLEELSSIANFSKYHFHRIFHGIVGETTNHYILRIRLEKAATSLLYDPNKSVTEICYDCGFSSSSVFARAFKERYKLSPRDFRSKYLEEFSNIYQLNSNSSEVSKKLDQYFGEVLLNKNGVEKMEAIGDVIEAKKVNVQNCEEFTVAYLRYMGPYKGNAELFENLFTRLFGWAGPKNLCDQHTKVLSVYHDNPEITDEEKLRLSVCISVPEDTEVDGEIGKMKISGGKYAIASYELSGSKDYEKAWNYLYSHWLPTSGFIPDDNPCFEMYLNSPEEHPEKKHIVDIYVPVKEM